MPSAPVANFKVIVHAQQHHLIFQLCSLKQTARNSDPARAVHFNSTGHAEPESFISEQLVRFRIAVEQVVGSLLEPSLRVEVQCLSFSGSDLKYNRSPLMTPRFGLHLGTNFGGDSQPILGINSVFVRAGKDQNNVCPVGCTNGILAHNATQCNTLQPKIEKILKLGYGFLGSSRTKILTKPYYLTAIPEHGRLTKAQLS